MHVLVVVTTLALLARCAAAAAAPARGMVDAASSRLLLGGDELALRSGDANPFQFPWHAALLTATDQYFCGASIIDSRWVLTAGHCLDAFGDFHVTVGGLRLPDASSELTRQRFATSDKHIHPQFDMEFLDNDIGLLQLPSAIKSSIFVSAVQLPSYSMATADLTGKVVTVSGWGKMGDDLPPSAVLRYTEMRVLPDAECESVYGNTMTGNKLCLSAQDGNGVCQGDGGGALVIRRDGDVLGGETGDLVQVGITSFVSAEGCTVKLPQGFTKVASFLEFIEETTGIPIRD